jgi:hypothetical protein
MGSTVLKKPNLDIPLIECTNNGCGISIHVLGFNIMLPTTATISVQPTAGGEICAKTSCGEESMNTAILEALKKEAELKKMHRILDDFPKHQHRFSAY